VLISSLLSQPNNFMIFLHLGNWIYCLSFPVWTKNSPLNPYRPKTTKKNPPLGLLGGFLVC
jgi:hypothetical protein